MSDENRIGDLLAANANLILELDVALGRIATSERQVVELQAKWTNTVEAAARDWMNTPIPSQFSLFQAKPVAANYHGDCTATIPHIIGPHQPCHTFTAETGRIDADEPIIVDAKP